MQTDNNWRKRKIFKLTYDDKCPCEKECFKDGKICKCGPNCECLTIPTNYSNKCVSKFNNPENIISCYSDGNGIRNESLRGNGIIQNIKENKHENS